MPLATGIFQESKCRALIAAARAAALLAPVSQSIAETRVGRMKLQAAPISPEDMERLIQAPYDSPKEVLDKPDRWSRTKKTAQ